MHTIQKRFYKNLIAVSVLAGVGMSAGAASALAQSTPPPFDEALVRFRQVRAEFDKRRTEVQTARPEDRVQAEGRLRGVRREHLQRMLDLLERRELDLRQRVVDNRRIYSARVERIRAEADEEIKRLREFRARAGINKTEAELQTIAAELRARHRAHAEETRKEVLLAHIERFGGDIERAEVTSRRIGAKIAELERAGKDVSALKQLHADAEAKLASVKSQLAELSTMVRTQDMTSEFFTTVRQKMNALKAEMRSVYDLFMGIARHEQAQS